MTKWQNKTEIPRSRNALEVGPVCLSVSQEEGEQTWQHLCISFGYFNAGTPEECLESWPRVAIEKAREALDRFEDTLDERRLDETTV
jgi:hypothetical protein